MYIGDDQMVSALENSGIEAVWDTVQEYKTKMEVHLQSHVHMYVHVHDY